MTTDQAVPALPYLDGDAVRSGELPVEISMEPITAGAPFAYETVISDGADGFFAVWACDAGVYPRNKDYRGSFMYILDGDASIVDQDGTTHELTADSVIVLPFGWIGQWDIRRTIRKVYLHSFPVPPFREGVQPSAFLDAAGVLGELPAGGAVVFDGPDGVCSVRDLWHGSHTVTDDGRARFLFAVSGEADVVGDDGSTVALAAGGVITLPSGWSGALEVTTGLRLFDVVTTPTR